MLLCGPPLGGWRRECLGIKITLSRDKPPTSQGWRKENELKIISGLDWVKHPFRGRDRQLAWVKHPLRGRERQQAWVKHPLSGRERKQT